jgi:Family of unknown function (DUF5677)
MEEDTLLPEPPSFSEDDMRHCREAGDFKPLLFEWYKFVGSLGSVVAHIQPDSPAFRPIPAQHYYVLMGLLNRCVRLMLSNVALSHKGKFGETTALVDRCIFESAIKLIWLCRSASQDEFTRYLASGLKTELELKASIEQAIATRGGVTLPIETRMLASIDKHISASGLSTAEIASTSNLRDLAAIIQGLGHDRLFYVVGQRIGSHHVHGTWSSLMFHYLQEHDFGNSYKFAPRGHDCATHINQLMFVPLIVLAAMAEYARYTLDKDDADAFDVLFASTKDEIMRIYNEAGEDAR